MEKDLDFTKLYLLQDEILAILFSLDNNFYLTGGTALHRFYYNLRYSNDLDFFSQQDPNFHEFIDQFIFQLQEKNIKYSRPVNSKNFCRIVINDFLQLDFVNDYVYREGVSKIVNRMRIDNVFNILTNKLGALLDRDEEKDFFDFFAIAFHKKFNWGKILHSANKKAYIDKEQLIYRIETFPLEWLERIKYIEPLVINKNHVTAIIDDIFNERANSLSAGN